VCLCCCSGRWGAVGVLEVWVVWRGGGWWWGGVGGCGGGGKFSVLKGS